MLHNFSKLIGIGDMLPISPSSELHFLHALAPDFNACFTSPEVGLMNGDLGVPQRSFLFEEHSF